MALKAISVQEGANLRLEPGHRFGGVNQATGRRDASQCQSAFDHDEFRLA